MTGDKKRVFVAMSGGVDSSVAAHLLKEQDYDVVGVFMRCYNLDGCAERDAEDARRVAEHLKIPFYVWDFEAEYKKRVVDYMIRGYRQGITPNPDVMCNKEIKFGLFLEKALSTGADYVATGHYVSLERDLKTENRKLKIARDSAKDQSYFLWTLTQNQLKHCLFPIGEYLKSEICQIARKAGLPTADKKDSQGICFLGKVTLGDFLKEYIPEKRGEVVSVAGEKLGEHDGAYFYTIGQRHLGIRDYGLRRRGHEPKPVYVVAKDVRANTVVVAEGSDHPALYKKEIAIMDINFISSDYYSTIRAKGGMEVWAIVRYRQPLTEAKLVISNSKLENGGGIPITDYQLLFTKPVKFVAPGQSAVFYSKKGEMLGGGVIL